MPRRSLKGFLPLLAVVPATLPSLYRAGGAQSLAIVAAMLRVVAPFLIVTATIGLGIAIALRIANQSNRPS